MQIQHNWRPTIRFPILLRLKVFSWSGRWYKTSNVSCILNHRHCSAALFYGHTLRKRVACWFWVQFCCEWTLNNSYLVPLWEHLWATEWVFHSSFHFHHSEQTANCKMTCCCQQPTCCHALLRDFFSITRLPIVFKRKYKKINKLWSRSPWSQRSAFKYYFTSSFTWDLSPDI